MSMIVVEGDVEYAADSFLVRFRKECGLSDEECAAKVQRHLEDSFREDGLDFSFRVYRFFALLQVHYPSAATDQEVFAFYAKVKQQLQSSCKDFIKNVCGNRVIRG